MNKTKHLSEDNVKTLCSFIREVSKISDAIDDLNIATNSTYSSFKVTELAKTLKEDMEHYVNTSISNLTHLEKEIVTVLPNVSDAKDNIIYLLKDTSITNEDVYVQYLLIDGALVSIGSTKVNLDNLYTKSEADAKFALITDLSAINTAIGGLTTLNTTAKDTLVNAINEVLSLLNSGLDKKVDKDSIVTTINSTVTDEQVPSALATYNAIKDLDSVYNFDYKNSTTLNINLNKAGLYKFSTITEGAPNDNPGDYTLFNIPWMKNSDTLRYGMQLLFSPRVEHFYFRRVWNYLPDSYTYTEGDYSVFGKWNVCGQKTPFTLGCESYIVTEIKENEDLNNFTTLGVYVCKSYTIARTLTNIPERIKKFAFKMEVSALSSDIYEQRIYNVNSTDGLLYVRNRISSGSWGSWKKVCTTSVEDIEVTSLVPENTTNYYNADTTSTIQSSHYCVKNGICTINVGLSCTTPSTSFITLFSGLPKPKAKYTFRAFSYNSTNGITQVNININTKGAFLINGGKAGEIWYTANISYPVAE